jgi:DNA polymerase III subunit beta
MLIQSDREHLLVPLQSVAGIVDRRHTLPILSNVLIESKPGELLMTASDLEVEIRARAEQAPDAPAVTLTASARKMLDIVRALPEQSKLTLDLKDNRLLLNAGKSRFTLQTLAADAFPAMQAPAETNSRFELPQKTLRALIEKVQFAMAHQDIRYYLNGMLLSLSGDMLTLVATDGHRLSLSRHQLEAPCDPAEVILPRKTVQELARLLDLSDAPVAVELYANQARFRFGNLEMTTKVIDGKYPDYNRVIPQGYNRHFEVNRVAFQAALQRAAILSTDKFRGVRILLTKDTLGVICTNADQEEAQETVDISYNEQALDIGFNITYLLDLLSHIGTEIVHCECGDANSGIVFTIAEDPHFKHVVMPMRI